MRRVPSIIRLALPACLALAGCSGGGSSSDDGEVRQAPNVAVPNASAPNASAPNSAAPNSAAPAEEEETGGKPAGNTAVSFEADKVEFRYSWPAQAAAIAPLDRWLRGNGERLMRQTRAGAATEQASAKKEGYAFPGYGYTEDWSVVADLPALLVMQSEGYSFTGGAHGMPIVTTLLWDRTGRMRLATGALFNVRALSAALKDRFCRALDAEREKRRGAPVKHDKDQLDEFDKCVDIARQTILPVSANGKALDTVRIVIMPYEAGPYAEGIYEIDLPVDAAVLKAVRPAWRGSFSAGS